MRFGAAMYGTSMSRGLFLCASSGPSIHEGGGFRKQINKSENIQLRNIGTSLLKT